MEKVSLNGIGTFDIGFRIKDFEYKEIDGKRIRIIKKVKLWEVSLVTNPAKMKKVVYK